MHFPSLFCLWVFVVYNYGEGFILPLHLNYIWVFMDMFVHPIIFYVLLCLCMLYIIIVGYTSSWYFVLYISCAWFIPPLNHCYKCVYINILVNVIYMVNVIFLYNSYILLLGCATSCESCHAYFLYVICYFIVVILFDLHSQNWINILLF